MRQADVKQEEGSAVEPDTSGDKWKTVAIETIGQKYIAHKQSYSNEGAVYSVVKINPQRQGENVNVTYAEEVHSRFRIRVQILGQKSKPTGVDKRRREAKAGRVDERKDQAYRKKIPAGRVHKKTPATTRKAVGAKKATSTVTPAGRRILNFRRGRNEPRVVQETQGISTFSMYWY